MRFTAPDTIMAGYPISTTCPSCGHATFAGVPPDRTVAFEYDRVCSACGTRYTPPTPLWGSALFLLIGLSMAVFSLLAITGLLERLEPTGEDSTSLRLRSIVALVVGVMLAGYGLRSLRQRPSAARPAVLPAAGFTRRHEPAPIAAATLPHSKFGIAATGCALVSLCCTAGQLEPFRGTSSPLGFGNPLSLAALLSAIIGIKLALKCLSEDNVRGIFQWTGLAGSILALLGCALTAAS